MSWLPISGGSSIFVWEDFHILRETLKGANQLSSATMYRPEDVGVTVMTDEFGNRTRGGVNAAVKRGRTRPTLPRNHLYLWPYCLNVKCHDIVN